MRGIQILTISLIFIATPSNGMCPPVLSGDAVQTSTTLFPYAVPSVFRNIEGIDDLLRFMRIPPSQVTAATMNSFEHHPQEVLREVMRMGALFGKSVYHFLAERGETEAIRYLWGDSKGERENPPFDPLREDIMGLRASEYALNSGHGATYAFLIGLELSIGGARTAVLDFSGVDLGLNEIVRLQNDEMTAIASRVFRYYEVVDRSEVVEGKPNSFLEEMFSFFGSRIIYARNSRDIYTGMDEFRQFYLGKRDIAGQHSGVRIKIFRPINDRVVYIATQGEFHGKIISTGADVDANFYDHFLYDHDSGQFVRRMSDIDQKI